MTEPLTYRGGHSTGRVDLTLVGDRFLVKTCGTGLIDKPRELDISVADLRLFAVTPTIAAQHAGGNEGGRDHELIFTYAAGGSVKLRRMFVAASDPAFCAILARLQALRPEASLLGRPADDAYRALGVMSPRRGVIIVLAVLLVGPPLLGLLGWGLFHALH